jgi:hypothetical protein
MVRTFITYHDFMHGTTLAKHGGRLFAFVLMTNHVHLWVLCATPGRISG